MSNTTKPTAPKEDENVYYENLVRKIHPDVLKIRDYINNKTILNHLKSPFFTFNFIKSIYGEIRYSTKLGLENTIKQHCINTCFSYEGSNIHQTEKLCMVNCVSEGAEFIEGFYSFKEEQLANSKENKNFTLSNSIPIKRLI
jgi:hypothetical protein